MKKILVVALALVMCFALCSVASAKTYELKISTTQTDSSMIYAGLQAAADEIMEKTNGEVKVSIYPSSQLGGEEDMIDQAIAGIGVAVLTDAGRMSSYVNDIGIFNMAYFVDSYEAGLKVIATDTFPPASVPSINCINVFVLKNASAIATICDTVFTFPSQLAAIT